jgi:hypothetical protein
MAEALVSNATMGSWCNNVVPLSRSEKVRALTQIGEFSRLMFQSGASIGIFDTYMSHQLNNEFEVMLKRSMTKPITPVFSSAKMSLRLSQYSFLCYVPTVTLAIYHAANGLALSRNRREVEATTGPLWRRTDLSWRASSEHSTVEALRQQVSKKLCDAVSTMYYAVLSRQPCTTCLHLLSHTQLGPIASLFGFVLVVRPAHT